MSDLSSHRCPKVAHPGRIGLTEVVGQDVGLMVRGFAAALEDPQILVQRGILELLITTLRLDSAGFRKCVENLQSTFDRSETKANDPLLGYSTRPEDKVLLMRAAIGVVLRRDLSLSRRLYTWLLGSSDSSEAQVQHLRDYGLELLRLALKTEMDAQHGGSETIERQRPFKIFISLLDKWEIGAVLTEVLVLDAFGALHKNLRPEDDHDEVRYSSCPTPLLETHPLSTCQLLLTGNMLFEILDPFLLWKQIYLSIKKTMSSESGAVEVRHRPFSSKANLLTVSYR